MAWPKCVVGALLIIPVGDLIAFLKKNQNAPRPSEYYSILVSFLVDIRVFDYARTLYGIQLIFRSIITF